MVGEKLCGNGDKKGNETPGENQPGVIFDLCKNRGILQKNDPKGAQPQRVCAPKKIREKKSGYPARGVVECKVIAEQGNGSARVHEDHPFTLFKVAFANQVNETRRALGGINGIQQD